MCVQGLLERKDYNKIGMMRTMYEVRWYEFNLTEQCSRKFFTALGAEIFKLYLECVKGAIAKIYEL